VFPGEKITTTPAIPNPTAVKIVNAIYIQVNAEITPEIRSNQTFKRLPHSQLHLHASSPLAAAIHPPPSFSSTLTNHRVRFRFITDSSHVNLADLIRGEHCLSSPELFKMALSPGSLLPLSHRWLQI
jgi:hypothetical protein